MNGVQKTTDYDLFNKVVGNRKVIQSHVRKLKDSIRIKDMLEQNPIIVNERMEIIDGQHRLRAAKALNKAIYYTTVGTAELEEIHLLNSNMKTWGMSDFLESYIAKGVKDYQILKDFAHHYGLTYSVAMTLIGGKNAKHKDAIHEFKSGKFIVTNLEEGDRKAKDLLVLKDYCENGVWKNRDFIASIEKVWEKIEPVSFLKKVEARGVKFRKRASMRDYLRDFEDTYNFNQKTNHIKFY